MVRIIYNIRLNREIEGMKFITTNIHPIWAIEEYARIFRSCV